MADFCYCCFAEIPNGVAHPATYTSKIGGSTVIQHVSVCTACRRLGCDVMNPEGCKRPESIAQRQTETAGGR